MKLFEAVKLLRERDFAVASTAESDSRGRLLYELKWPQGFKEKVSCRALANIAELYKQVYG